MKKTPSIKNRSSKLMERLKDRVKSRASTAHGAPKSPEDHKDRNTDEFKKADTQLQMETEKRKWAEEQLKKAREELERRVKERTAELVKTQEQLSKAVRILSAHKRQLRSMASHHTISEERERRKLAVYLHDNICQSLGVAKMKLDALRESGSSSDFTAALDEVTQIIKSTIQDVRSVMVDLSPPVLHELGFEAALEWLAEQFHEQNGIPCAYENDEHPKPLDEDVRILLFQSVRELLINIIKHAAMDITKGTIPLKIVNMGTSSATPAMM